MILPYFSSGSSSWEVDHSSLGLLSQLLLSNRNSKISDNKRQVKAGSTLSWLLACVACNDWQHLSSPAPDWSSPQWLSPGFSSLILSGLGYKYSLNCQLQDTLPCPFFLLYLNSAYTFVSSPSIENTLNCLDSNFLIGMYHLFAVRFLIYKSELAKPINTQIKEWGAIARAKGWSSWSEGLLLIKGTEGHETGLSHPGKVFLNI